MPANGLPDSFFCYVKAVGVRVFDSILTQLFYESLILLKDLLSFLFPQGRFNILRELRGCFTTFIANRRQACVEGSQGLRISNYKFFDLLIFCRIAEQGKIGSDSSQLDICQGLIILLQRGLIRFDFLYL